MAVVSWELHWRGVTGGATGTSFAGSSRSYAAHFRLTTNNPLDQVDTIINYFETTPGLPKLGDEYRYGNDYNPNSICTGISPDHVDNSRIHWDVVVSYSPKSDPTGEGTKDPTEPDSVSGQPTTDPLRWQNEYEISHSQISVPVWKAKLISGFKGKAAARWPAGTIGTPCNSAGIPYNPPLERQLTLTSLAITKFRPNYDGIYYRQFAEATNSDLLAIDNHFYRLKLWWVFNTVLVKNIGGSYHLENGVKFWRIRILLQHHPLGWDVEVPDLGVTKATAKEKVDPLDNEPPPGVDHSHILDADGVPLAEPVLLDGDGLPLDDPKPDNTVWIRYRVYLNQRPLRELMF